MQPAVPEHESPSTGAWDERAAGSRTERVLGALLLAGTVVLLALSLSTNAATRFHAWPWTLYWHLFLVLPPLAFVAGAGARRPAPRLGAMLDIGLCGWAAVALAGAWLSPYRWQSVNAALLPLAGVCLAYMVRGWLGFDPEISRRRAARVLTIIGLGATAFIVVSFAYWLAFDVLPALERGSPFVQALRIRNQHPFGHANYTAGFAVLALPVLAGLAVCARGAPRAGWAGASVLALALILTSGSRGGVLAILVVAGGLALLVLLNRSINRRWKFALAGAALTAAVLLVALNPRLREFVVRREWSEVAAESNRQRSAMFAAGLAMGADHPVVGYGPGTVSLAYPRYRPRLAGGVDNVLELHNTPVQVWAEHGALGLVALLALGIGVACAVWRLAPWGSAATTGSHNDRVRARSLVFALAGYGVFALTDHQLDVPLFVAALAAMLAILSTLSRPASATHISWSPGILRAIPAAAVLAATASIGWFTVPNLRAREAFVRGVIAFERGDAAAFVAGAQRAREFAPHEPFYLNQLALHRADQADRVDDPAKTTVLRSQAVARFQQSLALRPEQEICHFNLGWLSLDLDAPAEAARHFRAAAQLVPDKGGVYFGLGLALLLQGKSDDAAKAFALEWINDPRAMTNPAWEKDGLRERRTAVATAALEKLESISTAGDEPRAKRVAAVLRWWIEPTTENAARAAIAAYDSEAAEFFRMLAGEAAPPTNIASPWLILHDAWRAAEPATVLTNLPARVQYLREPLAARIAAHRDSFAAMFVAPVSGSDGLTRHRRNERIAYGMLMRNSDGLRVLDRVAFEENVVATDLLPFLFPPKGWLETPALVKLLTTIPE